MGAPVDDQHRHGTQVSRESAVLGEFGGGLGARVVGPEDHEPVAAGLERCRSLDDGFRGVRRAVVELAVVHADALRVRRIRGRVTQEGGEHDVDFVR